MCWILYIFPRFTHHVIVVSGFDIVHCWPVNPRELNLPSTAKSLPPEFDGEDSHVCFMRLRFSRSTNCLLWAYIHWLFGLHQSFQRKWCKSVSCILVVKQSTFWKSWVKIVIVRTLYMYCICNLKCVILMILTQKNPNKS